MRQGTDYITLGTCLIMISSLGQVKVASPVEVLDILVRVPGMGLVADMNGLADTRQDQPGAVVTRALQVGEIVDRNQLYGVVNTRIFIMTMPQLRE